jgi:hypothetical protein
MTDCITRALITEITGTVNAAERSEGDVVSSTSLRFSAA